MKKSVILCCVACCLLAAFPRHEGSKLQDSLYCVLQFSEELITCSWSESRGSTQFVNMSLKEIHGDKLSSACEKMEPVKCTSTHQCWTCHKHFLGTLYDTLHFTFIPNRSLESRLNVSNEGDDAKPKDLRCQASDWMINCSWRVRQEVVDSVDFTLYYQNVYGKEEACQPSCQREIPPYLFCACNFPAFDNHSIQLYNIIVRPTNPKANSVTFEVCKNIKLCPMNITVEEISKGEMFEISWKNEVEKFDSTLFFKDHYEICYWRENEMKRNEVAFDCPGVNKTVPWSGTHLNSTHLRLATQLEPSSNYFVKARVRLAEPREKCYKGPWSEWSNVQTFHTKSDLHILLLCFLVVSAVVVFVICTVCGCRALVRYRKQWEDTIPNPSKSSIVKDLQTAKDKLVIGDLNLQNGKSFPYKDHLYVEPYNKLMWPLSKKDTDLLKQDEKQINKPHSEFLQIDNTQCLHLFKMTLEEAPTASPTTEYTPLSELIKEQENRSMENSQVTVCDFDGPYLFS
ncbi:hypothetical protein PRIEUP_LOCUS595 [Pristimantis euphronides]